MTIPPDALLLPALLSLTIGLVASALYFAGLAWTTRAVLRSRAAGALLLLSFALRSALLLGLGAALMRVWNPLVVLPAYLAAFVAVRLVAVARSRHKIRQAQPMHDAGAPSEGAGPCS